MADTLTRPELIRRVARLCCNCVRNIAFYRAAWNGDKLAFNSPSQFLITANCNFLDIAVLEWLKLFNESEIHGWVKVVSDEANFASELFSSLQTTEEEFEHFTKEIRIYRNKFIAHLDTHLTMHIPKMDTLRDSAIFYFEYVLRHESNGVSLTDGPRNLTVYYNECMALGRNSYQGL